MDIMTDEQAEYLFKQIGTVYSPFSDLKGMPIQPTGARGVRGTVRVFPEYSEGLKDLEGFSHIYLFYCFHRSQGYAFTVTPFLDKEERGLFSTRAPRRPNPIGLSVVRLLRREENKLYIEGVDILDGTPLLDIKPFVPEFDCPESDSVGWLAGKSENAQNIGSDDRFIKDGT